MLKYILELSALLPVCTLLSILVGMDRHLLVIEERGHLSEKDLEDQTDAVRACQEISDDTTSRNSRIMQCVQRKQERPRKYLQSA